MFASAAKDVRFLDWRETLAYSLAGLAAFHAAFLFRPAGFLIAVWLMSLFKLSFVRTPGRAFWLGLAVGMAAYGPHLYFFWPLFGAQALELWAVPALWVALFMLISRVWVKRYGRIAAAIAIPLFWFGLEWFRSETYPICFSWFTAGHAVADGGGFPIVHYVGTYGLGLVIMLAIGFLGLLKKGVAAGIALLAIFGLLTQIPALSPGGGSSQSDPMLVGIQLEGQPLDAIIGAMNEAVIEYPHADILVMGEYVFDRHPPYGVRYVCRQKGKYLIAGGTDPVAPDDEKRFYNTAFVVGRNGEIVFRQAKSVPVQVFNDGLPAREQKVWASPWGSIGVCLCYDMCYAHVTDGLIRQGARAIVSPAMDGIGWGEHEHRLDAKFASLRAAEYGVPVFRLATSGYSQLILPGGTVAAEAPYPGRKAMIAGRLPMNETGSIPPDRVAARPAFYLTVIVAVWLLISGIFRKIEKKYLSSDDLVRSAER